MCFSSVVFGRLVGAVISVIISVMLVPVKTNVDLRRRTKQKNIGLYQLKVDQWVQ